MKPRVLRRGLIICKNLTSGDSSGLPQQIHDRFQHPSANGPRFIRYSEAMLTNGTRINISHLHTRTHWQAITYKAPQYSGNGSGDRHATVIRIYYGYRLSLLYLVSDLAQTIQRTGERRRQDAFNAVSANRAGYSCIWFGTTL